jgi:DUF2075 family protein
MSAMGDWGWAGTVAEFLATPVERWSASLAEHHLRLMGCDPAGTQVAAWRDEHAAMTSVLRAAIVADPSAQQWGISFEYELPLEGGRRPDVVVLAGRAVVVLEFKSAGRPTVSDLDQVAGYARDLADYHQATHDRTVVPLLVLTGAALGYAETAEGVTVCAPDAITPYLLDASEPGDPAIREWLDSAYEPLPTLVEAARRIFRDEPLPHVKTALSVGIPETVELLGRLVDGAAAEGRRIMAFVTGVPGAGKTLVGLRLVYERSVDHGRATFLSGNGPLVDVLQDALASRVFVRDLHAYIKTHALNQRPKPPNEHVVVFDEAQRAWDKHFMNAKRRVMASEPELLVQIGERMEQWAALVGLVGEGQEIYSGEEGGMEQWAEAVRPPSATEDWTVYVPPKLEDVFEGTVVETHERLDLTVSLRTKRAKELHEWVRLVLTGSLALAARQARRIPAAGYPMYVTRDLEDAKAYARERYVDEPTKRYGLICSSQAKNLVHHGIDNDFQATKQLKIGRWFNAPSDDPSSCCALSAPATEFQCQGLELDLPIVCWGSDYRYEHARWTLHPKRRKYPLADPEQLLTNTYRVLLTRGREGLVVWVPPDAAMDETETALLAAGLRPLVLDELQAVASG